MNRLDSSTIISVKLSLDQVLSLQDYQNEIVRLLDLATEIHRGADSFRDVRLVIVEQKGNCGAWPWGDLRAFNVEALRDELRHAMVLLRLLIRLIVDSPAKWFYVARGDCLGAFYEIARSCDRMMMVDQSAKVGFPEIRLGLFPVGGWLEQEVRRLPKQLDFWQKKPIQEARSSRSHDRLELSIQWQSLDLADDALQQRLLNYANRLEGRADRSSTIRDPLISYYQLWLKKPLKSERRPLPLERYRDLWELSRERLRKSEPEQMFAVWLIDMAAFYLTSHLFLSRLAWPRPSYTKLKRRRELSYHALLIDLKEIRPPIQIVSHLLEQRVPLIFFDESPTHLRRSLELIYGLLEKLSSPEAIDLWRQYVSWYSTNEVALYDRAFPVLECSLQDTISWRVGDEHILGWIVENHPDRPIYLEVDEKQKQGDYWLSLTGGELLVTPFQDHGLPWVHLLRSWALEELILLGREFSFSLVALIQELKHAGWGFLGDEFLWERFVTRRLSLKAYRRSMSVRRKPLRQEIFDLGPWKVIKSMTPAISQNQEFMASRRLSLHFLYLAALMWAVLCEKAEGSMDRDVADVLVSRALGLPADWGRISVFVETWGLRRCQVYVGQNWGDLVEALESLRDVG